MKDITKVQEKLISNIIENIQKDPQKRIPELAELIIKLDTEKKWESKYGFIQDIAVNKDNKINKMIYQILQNCDEELVKNLITNFLINAVIKGNIRQHEIKDLYNLTVPKIIDITYNGIRKNDITYLISYETLSKIVMDGKDLGVYVYNISAFDHIQPKDMLKLAMKNSNCIFLLNINQVEVDPKFIQNCKQMGNVIFILDIELSHDKEDRAIYKEYFKQIKYLKENKMVFGVKTLITPENLDIVLSQSFMRKLSNKGALFSIYSYDVITLYNEDIDFEQINNELYDAQEKYPMLFIKNCEYIQSKIEIAVNQNQVIKILDIENTIDVKNYRKSIFDVMCQRYYEQKDVKEQVQKPKGKIHNFRQWAKDIFIKSKKDENKVNDDFEDLKAS